MNCDRCRDTGLVPASPTHRYFVMDCHCKSDPHPVIADRVEIAESGCWNWTGSIQSEGYGSLSIEGKSLYAHRVSYELINGSIDDGMEIDHLCRNRRCVNPHHLEQVTHRENVHRGTSPAAVNAAKTSCIRGHELDDENTYIQKNGKRQCRVCTRIRKLLFWANHSEDPSRVSRLASRAAAMAPDDETLEEQTARLLKKVEYLEEQLRNERRISGAVADAELWRQGALR